MLEIVCYQIVIKRQKEIPKTQSFRGFPGLCLSLPLNRSRGFVGYVIEDAVDVGDFGNDALGDAAQQAVRQG